MRFNLAGDSTIKLSVTHCLHPTIQADIKGRAARMAALCHIGLSQLPAAVEAAELSDKYQPATVRRLCPMVKVNRAVLMMAFVLRDAAHTPLFIELKVFMQLKLIQNAES